MRLSKGKWEDPADPSVAKVSGEGFVGDEQRLRIS